MGLATSQVRLLALTSRKADVEMQIQLNSKRKTMLTREATELAKLYYAKLQNARIQYSTTNGYKDVTYNYLMGADNSNYFDQVVSPNADSSIDRKASDSMILTDIYGRVILSDNMIGFIVDTLNNGLTPGLEDTIHYPDGTTGDSKETTATRTITAMNFLLASMAGKSSNPLGDSATAASMYDIYNALYTGSAWKNSTGSDNPQLGLEILQHLLNNGYKNGGTIYRKGIEATGYKYYSSENCAAGTEITPENGTFYIIKNVSNNNQYVVGDGITAGGSGSMFWNGELVPMINTVVAQQICNMNNYYGSIFSAAFNGSDNLNVAADITYNETTQKYEAVPSGNTAYKAVSQVEQLQAGLKSGLYQLVNVSSPVTGGYEKAQGLDYFKTLNYVVEQADSSDRDTITAWYDAARADLNEKESYWDSEITALSAELNTITTEIDSVKKLREDAISSTFKWGNA